MHTSFNYTYEAAATEIDAFLSGEMPTRGVQYRAKGRTWQEHAHDDLPDAHFICDDCGLGYASNKEYRDYLIDKGIIVPDKGKKMLSLDEAGCRAAAAEIEDYFENGAYADRGIVIDGGKAVFPEDVRESRERDEE